MQDFGARLRALRQLRGWSQEYVGLELGVSKATVSKWETGRAQPSLEHLASIRGMYAADGGTLDFLVAGVPTAGMQTDQTQEGISGPAEASMQSSALVASCLLDTDEQILLMRFRQLCLSQRKGLLAFLHSPQSAVA